MNTDRKQFFNLTSADGTVLGATYFSASQNHRGEILVAGATAVPQGFYRRFAEFANQEGFGVTTLDYRGIGKSAPNSLRGYRCNYLDWGRQDLPAAVEKIKVQNPDRPIYMIGHSYGGHGFGLMPNHADIKAFYTFASGAGWSGHMPKAERLKVGLMWHVLGPAIVPFLGYMPGQLIGGENLPIDVYRQWKRWCGFPHYFFDDPSMQNGELDRFKQVRTPIAAANALDDLWAPPVSRDYFFKGYTRAPLTTIDLDPGSLKSPIGHMGYFRQGREALWADALRWLENQTDMAGNQT
jgi:predicted alpha/beta hydrolase